MLNQVILVGKVLEEIESFVDHDGNILSKILLEIVSYKSEVEEVSNKIPVLLNKDLASSIYEYLKVGMTIGVKAHIKSTDDSIVVMGEKLTFISIIEGNDS